MKPTPAPVDRDEEIARLRADVERETRELGQLLHALLLAECAADARPGTPSIVDVAAGVAHEIRGPLSAIRGFAGLLDREVHPGSRAGHYAQRILEGLDEADQIVASLLAFGTSRPLDLELVEPGPLVASATASGKRVLPTDRTGKEWRVVSSVSAPPFLADRIKVRQALRNLIANALEAQPDGGTVNVSVALDGDDVVFRVQDAGPGVPPEIRARLGQPFVTTRPDGHGRGLALVHAIAVLHGGRFEVSPCPAPLGGADIAFRIPFQPQ